MSSSAGLHTPRSPFSGAAPLALRPLSAIAASAAGGVPEARIKRLLSDLLPSLMGLHAQGEICGDISLDTVGMDEGARAHLLPELALPRSRRTGLTPIPGFAPFELYTDSAEWPRGPWTDVYALCAVMHALVIGLRPPPAPERRATDSYEPLLSLGLTKYSPAFLGAIDRGLAMLPADRPQTLAELAAMLDIPAYAEAAPVAREASRADVAAPVAPAAQEVRKPRNAGRPLLVLLLLVALIGVGIYAWVRLGIGTTNSLITRSEVVQPNPPAVPTTAPADPPASTAAPASTPAPQPAPPVPVAGTALGSAPEAAPKGERGAAAATPADAPVGSAPPAPASSAMPTEPASAATAPIPEAAAPAQDEAPKPKPVPVLVRLDIRPWGEVWINGVARGISPPVKELRLIPGKYQVVLRNADLPPYRTTLEVRPGKPAVISHVFE
ncbi:serine/threonine protein kinase [Achromobacter xylosoxidans]|uniref:serine/threonine protein kinase n=1 Tax=Alcaligenes xylosoxydans xylosoxydans TaxID=85698 RepID=UPI0006C4C926|nr:serine/threonine protein kinase [Achromobacter xylosoxidans]MCH4575790.1 serine/threonine protein kinase [Achromobacter xylosoxidans]MDD7987560.1 serine/threonine protein kinase [Achromobacter xylosoxidans]MDZ5619128.1 serine/threonine protein kinase [Achromobacter xylosoxidans]MDZ5628924.1 serine/threonine protein kinase [Achromobacter xylosoxidans]MDZ5688906.1 serine/threonine protein kinase [Achromobacter xylosoxidans]